MPHRTWNSSRFLCCLAAAALLFPAVHAVADHYPRQAAVDIRHYNFTLELRDDTDALSGEAAIDLLFNAGGVRELVLDLVNRSADGKTGMTVSSVRSEAGPLSFRHENDRLHIDIDPPSVKGARRCLTVTYSGVPADGLIIGKTKHAERAFFADNFPDRARFWIPTIDHPYDKATCAFAVTAPETYQVVATGEVVETTSLAGGRRLTRYRTTVPVATYCMVVGLARFAVETIGRVGCVPVQSWVYAAERDPGFFDFRIALKPMEFYSWKIGPFPYEKLANVQSKTRYGGMENASAVFYHENVVTGQNRAENLFAHEIAHQWFGDSVTEADWDHTWLSEGFATYFTHVYEEYEKGRDMLVSGLRRDRDRVLRYHQRNPEAALVTPASPDLRNILSTNSYQKGGWFLHMLRRLVGDETFWKGISEYYSRFKNGTALTDDLRAVMEEASGKNLEPFFRQWAFTPGQPEIGGDWSYADGVLTVNLRQLQGGETVFRTDIDLGFVPEAGAAPNVETVRMEGREETFSFKLEKEPADVVLDPNVWLLWKPGPFGRAK
ncbi:MAG: M1 family metallopeptidase [Candidatus Aminicenantes bacterium]|nr:M1 family metallopeptidase [Candidatus Aminicenantes bacterium]